MTLVEEPAAIVTIVVVAIVVVTSLGGWGVVSTVEEEPGKVVVLPGPVTCRRRSWGVPRPAEEDLTVLLISLCIPQPSSTPRSVFPTVRGAGRGPAGKPPRAPDGMGQLSVVRPGRPKGRTTVFG